MLRFGAYGENVINIELDGEDTLSDLKEALEIHGPIDIKSMNAQALQMGDEMHNRNKRAPHCLSARSRPAS